MPMPANSKNPEAALASLKIATHNFFLQNNDLMDMIVVAENDASPKKDHASIAEKSMKIDPSEMMEESTSSEQP
jgi:hypothetical protein